jgi:hypothetical protein
MLSNVVMVADEAGVRKMSLTGLEAGFYAWIAAPAWRAGRVDPLIALRA